MTLQILSPDAKLFDGQANSVSFPGADGRFEVLDNHAPLIAALSEGEVRIREAGSAERTVRIGGGFVEVLNNEVSVLAEAAE